MADARIQDLDPVNQVQDNDNFVLEQNKKAHRLTGSKLIRYLITACDKLGILGVHVGPDEPKENQNVWIEEVEDYNIPDEAFAGFDTRYVRKGEIPTPFDDTQVSTEKGWTSSNIVETLCPPFSKSGPVVTCNPVKGYPLHVISQIVPKQEGSGDPSPDNVRPIVPTSSVTLTQEAGETAKTYTTQLPPDTYGGEVDWASSKAIAYGKKIDYSNFKLGANKNANYARFNTPNFLCPRKRAGLSNIFKTFNAAGAYYANANGVYSPDKVLGKFYAIDLIISVNDLVPYGAILGNLSTYLPAFVAFSESKKAVYISLNADEREIVITTSGNPTTIPGVNTLYSDTGDTTVSGRENPIATINALTQRVADLESAQAQI